MTEEIYTKGNSNNLQNNPAWHVEDSPWKAKQTLSIIG